MVSVNLPNKIGLESIEARGLLRPENSFPLTRLRFLEQYGSHQPSCKPYELHVWGPTLHVPLYGVPSCGEKG